MRARTAAIAMGLCSLLLLGVTGVRAQQGSVSLMSQQRVVEAYATVPSTDRPGLVPSQTLESTEPGVFSERARAFMHGQQCCCGHCLSSSASADATQESSIENTADGALEIRATGATSAGQELGGRSGARSFLTALFGVHDEGVSSTRH
jgi:hypothetical protein